MKKSECLTAYTCKFRYLKRNNPMIEEQRDFIKAGESPEFSFSNFVDLYIEYTRDIAIGEGSDRAISMPEESVEFDEYDNNAITSCN